MRQAVHQKVVCGYRLTGKSFADQKLVSFSIRDAIPIENGKIVDEAGSPTVALCREEGAQAENNPSPVIKADSGAV